MSFSERLKLIVEADVSPALRGFEKLHTMAENFAGRVSSAVGHFQKFLALAGESGEMRQTQASFRGLGIDIERLQNAVGGTVSKMTLMGVANRAMRGEFGLTGTEMERVLGAADALNDQGFGKTAEIADRLALALKTGSTRSLREYGITVEDTKGKQAAVNELMQKFSDIAEQGGPVDRMNERFEQFNARLDDAVARLKMSLGTMVMSFLEAINGLFDAVENAGRKGQRDRDADEVLRQMGRQGRGKALLDESALGTVGRLGSRFTSIGEGAIGDVTTEAGGMLDEQMIANDPVLAQEFKARMIIVQARRAFEENQRQIADALKADARNKRRDRDRDRGGDGRFALAFEDVGEREIDLNAMLTGGSGSEKMAASSRRADLLFGPTESGGDRGKMAAGAGDVADIKDRQEAFDALMEDLANRQKIVGAAYGALSDGIAAAVDAAITGSGSIAGAFKKAVAASLRATAVQATVEALWNTAKGFAALATGNPAAAGFFKSAAVFAATAVAAGAGSALLGGGGGGGGGGGAAATGGGAGGFSRGSGGGGSGGQQITIIQIGDAFGDRQRTGEMIDQALRAAKRTGRVRDDSTSSVRFR